MSNELKKDILTIYTCGLNNNEIIQLFNNLYDDSIITIDENCLLAKIYIDKSMITEDKSLYIARLLEPISQYMYSIDEDKSIENWIIDYAKIYNKKIAIGEYRTKGEITYKLSLSDIDNKYIVKSKIANDDCSIATLFGIDIQIIQYDSIVSANCVYHMANNLLTDDINFSLAISGVFDGPMPRRGLTFIAVGDKDKIDVHRCRFEGADDEIREKAINKAMLYLLKKIKGDFDIKEI